MITISVRMSRFDERFRRLSQCILMCIENEKVSRSQSFEISCAVIYGTHFKVENALYRHVNQKMQSSN
jgi:hypothetical protein